MTGNTLVELGSVASLIKQVHFKIPQNQFIIAGLAQALHCFEEQSEKGLIFNLVFSELVNQLSGVKGMGSELEVAFEWKESVDGLASDDSIQISSPS
jgi:hypothetical protein